MKQMQYHINVYDNFSGVKSQETVGSESSVIDTIQEVNKNQIICCNRAGDVGVLTIKTSDQGSNQGPLNFGKSVISRSDVKNELVQLNLTDDYKEEKYWLKNFKIYQGTLIAAISCNNTLVWKLTPNPWKVGKTS